MVVVVVGGVPVTTIPRLSTDRNQSFADALSGSERFQMCHSVGTNETERPSSNAGSEETISQCFAAAPVAASAAGWKIAGNC